MRLTLARNDELKVAIQYDDEAEPERPLRLLFFPRFDHRFGPNDFDLIARLIWKANNRLKAAQSRGGMQQLIADQRATRNLRRQRERRQTKENRAGQSQQLGSGNRPLTGVVE